MKRATVATAALVVGMSFVASRGTSASAPASQSTPGATANGIAARVQAVYAQAATYRADFRQTFVSKMYGPMPPSGGDVIFEKPGKMSWRYAQPNGNCVASDGKMLQVYTAENQQMIQQPLGQSQYPAALAFLMGQGQ